MTNEELEIAMREMAGWCAEAFGLALPDHPAGHLSRLLTTAADRIQALTGPLANEHEWRQEAMARLEQLTGRVDL